MPPMGVAGGSVAGSCKKVPPQSCSASVTSSGWAASECRLTSSAADGGKSAPLLRTRCPMAGASLFTLLDDIATLLDDVSILTKVAAKKTAGVLGDDLALNAQQVTGVSASRELPVVWAVAKGSMVNKAILVPAALAISAWLPWLVTPLVMLGGAFLCFGGVEKLAHKFLHGKDEEATHKAELSRALADDSTDVVAWEKTKIKGAVRTDFILSAEIIVLSLGVV